MLQYNLERRKDAEANICAKASSKRRRAANVGDASTTSRTIEKGGVDSNKRGRDEPKSSIRRKRFKKSLHVLDGNAQPSYAGLSLVRVFWDTIRRKRFKKSLQK